MSAPIPARIRMTSAQRRAQLIEVGLALFAEKGIGWIHDSEREGLL